MTQGKQLEARPWWPQSRSRSIHSGEVFGKIVWVLGAG